jgi:hypothetical protein
MCSKYYFLYADLLFPILRTKMLPIIMLICAIEYTEKF